jgi:hypothetical protein
MFKRKPIIPPTPKCPEPPKDSSITSLETYARDRLKYDMHILNNFLELLYKAPEYISKDNRWVKICNNHIGYVQDILNSNYGDGATKKCKYCNSVFNGYMAGAMLEYHKNTKHKKEVETEMAITCACIGTVLIGIFGSLTDNLSTTSDKS